MRRIVCISVVIDVLLLMSWSAIAQERPVIQLPQDRMVAVITMDHLGGYGLPMRDNRPPLTIFADGTVRVIDGSGVVPPIEAKISAEELQDLLRFAIDECHFFDFDIVTAQRELVEEEDKSGLRISVFDAGTTVIRIRTAERDHKGEFYALGDYVKAYPAVKPLTDLFSVEQRLLHLFYEIKAGGEEGIAAALKLSNEYLKKAYPKVPLLALEDFFSIRQYTGDRRTLVFLPTSAAPKQTDTDQATRVQRLMSPEPEFSVEVEYTTGSAPSITVHNPPQ